MKNPFERKPSVHQENKPEKDIASAAEGAREIGPEQVPDIVKSAFKKLKDSIDGELNGQRGTCEDMGEGIKRYRLTTELRDEETRTLTAASPFMNLTPKGMYKEIVMTVDEKNGEILNSGVTYVPPSSLNSSFTQI